jgi:putative chitinase
MEAIITNTTWAKLSTAQSTDLPDDEKLRLNKGQEIYDLLSCSVVDDHYKLEVVPNQFIYLWKGHATVPDFKEIPELLTKEQLYSIAIYADYSKLDNLIDSLNQTLHKYEINTPLRICHFLAQVAHESDGFNTTEEYASGAAYEWREDLGNVYEGDGRKFKGRGLIQLTGRANYREFSQYLKIYDLEAYPELVAEPELACSSAGWFWSSRNLNALADQDNFDRIMLTINGGRTGEADRWAYLVRAKAAFGI